MPDGVPNYLSVDAQGNVVASFDGGVVTTLGANYVEAPQDHGISWTDGPGGAVLASVLSYKTGGIVGQELTARDDILNTRRARLFTGVSSTGDAAQISASVQDSNSSADVIFINSEGASDFFKIGSTKRSGSGRATIAWNGVATQAIVAINLPGAPNLASASAFMCVASPRTLPGDASAGPFVLEIENFTINQCVIRVFAVGFTPPAGNTHIDYIIWEQ